MLTRLQENPARPGMWLGTVLARLGALPGRLLAYARDRLTTAHDAARAVAPHQVRRPPVLVPGEPWADQAIAEVAALPPEHARCWEELLRHALALVTSRPAKKWRARARELLDALGADEVFGRTDRWLTTFATAPPGPANVHNEHNDTAVRGLLWLRAVAPEEDTSPRLLGMVVAGALDAQPRRTRVAGAAVHVLSTVDSEPALAEIARLANRITHRPTLRLLDRTLAVKADALGITRGEIEEIAVPHFGLTTTGRGTRAIGDAEVELVVEPTGVRTRWRDHDGMATKSVPASVRTENADELRALRAHVKDVNGTLTEQKARLERLFLEHRVWHFEQWRTRYLDHPLVGTIARRLIWIVGVRACVYYEGALRGLDGQPVPVRASDDVALWHPVDYETDEVLEWRELLTEQGIVQPFKQAHREVYALTEAERSTELFSTRFTAHILKQKRFHAIATARGWQNQPRSTMDTTCQPTVRELPEWGLRAELWVEGVGDGFDVAATESGGYHYVDTEHIRFYPLFAPENTAYAAGAGYAPWDDVDDLSDPLPLADVPPLVFSEVLRDVELFVDGASIGSDPAWQDDGADSSYREYWNSHGFGELSTAAATRREVLRRVLPALPIAQRCTVTDRFLEVRGDLRGYRIHLGSGNVVMQPDDQYLCVLARQAKGVGRGVWLPFEGDGMLRLILGKALLLAEDSAITDPTIAEQLR
ncbi:DUF4132 domain-containing protein [Allokutzneria sp. A3M-2-11 16]|uniref:DUF4132 domain-containing protein n=1 Tax=Allokutzneria sp. A3M-2-11 16 TaxID=2962043 RepID=UPI0020B87198|nr:DUF4132 domain-containing protein [Allokutzneria sp. A3M-2-11 16]MCP3798054.1 DUF4132 domain-containing protein [Allokutzneria sp. A3M-2-11 16]